jgi:hypothetical protein
MTVAAPQRTKKTSESYSLVDGPIAIGSFELAGHLGWAATHLIQQLHFLLSTDGLKGFVDRKGLKWIWNSYPAWAEALKHTQGAIEAGIERLLELDIIERKQMQNWRCNHAYHYRIKYAVLWAYLKEIGLKPSDSAWPLFEGIEEVESPVSKPVKKRFYNKDFFRRLATKKNKQEAPASQADAASIKNDAQNAGCQDEQPGPAQDSHAPAAAAEHPAEGRHSVNGAQDQTATIPPAAAPDPERKRELVLRLRQLHPTPMKETVSQALFRDFSLEEIEQQLAWLPERNPLDEARVLVAALRGKEGPWGPPTSVRKAQKQANSPEKKNALKSFLSGLVPHESTWTSALGDVFEVVSVNLSDLVVKIRKLGETEARALPYESALKWAGLAEGAS